MPRKGEIEVRITAHDADVCARWLRSVYLPAKANRVDTVLTPDFNVETRFLLDQLAVMMTRTAARKRTGGGSFMINVPRQLVERFLAVPYDPAMHLMDWLTPMAVGRMIATMRATVSARRGRPPLSPLERTSRVDRRRLVEERHRKRLMRQERVEAAHGVWTDEVRVRGETVLTTALKPTRI
ncbi:hypothetical protein CO731_01251 [Aminobacter sp. MSH1]|uniref:hypothetical protein n=1 Tax=Aminobacter sp. MSH1 TaxID=374606 RepID=UPI000D34EDCD|nr:hypothetical protein [Aminobacter sp. MSH1]AWC21798.1 hypothetical protein CO731_01251 [Aminobacter sp. MSH1]